MPSSLEQQRQEFTGRRFLAVPLAGLLAWLTIGTAGLLLNPAQVVWTLYIATGSIVYLGMGLSRLTGEDFFRRGQPRTPSTRCFLLRGMRCWYTPWPFRFSRLIYPPCRDGRDSDGADVAAAGLDYPALGRRVARRGAHGTRAGGVVPVPSAAGSWSFRF